MRVRRSKHTGRDGDGEGVMKSEMWIGRKEEEKGERKEKGEGGTLGV